MAGAAYLNVGGTEWVIIVFVALVLILGTGRLPDVARSLGRVSSEYKRARTEAESQLRGISNAGNDIVGPGTNIRGPVKDERQKFEMIAKSLDIDPAGKDTDSLKKLISDSVVGGTGLDDKEAATNERTDPDDAKNDGKTND